MKDFNITLLRKENDDNMYMYSGVWDDKTEHYKTESYKTY